MILKLRTVSLLMTAILLLGGCSIQHIGMFITENGTAPDADQDTVPDDVDRCPKTPLGTPVDQYGCSDDDDLDLVANRKDRCPATPPGVMVDAWGCSVDSDADGVLDSRDECPYTVADARVDGRGCTLDADRDGVMDYKDRCPDTPFGTPVDNWGCSDNRNRCEMCDRLPTLSGIHFELDSASLRPQAYPLLNQAVKVLEEFANARVKIVGHTDNQGTEAYNLDLSQRRAQSVAAYLIGHGIAAERLEPIGRGEMLAIASNATKEGRAQNRRVEFLVVD